MGYEIHLIDVCLPDYFQGSSQLVLAIPLYHSLRLAQLKEQLHQQVNDLWESLDEPAKVYQAVDDLESAMLFGGVDFCQEEDCDPVYAYFEVVAEED